MIEERHICGRAYRGDRLVASFVLLTVRAEVRIDPPRVHRQLGVRFAGVAPELRVELERLERSQAESCRSSSGPIVSAPIDLALGSPRGEERLPGCRLEAPAAGQQPLSLRDFGVWEPAARHGR